MRNLLSILIGPEHQNAGQKAHRALRATGSAVIVVAGITAYSLAFAASPASAGATRAQWRENMVHKATPGEGCFQAAFPAVRWEPAPCGKVTGQVHPLPRAKGLTGPQTVGNGNDYALVAPGANLITQTVGSFPSVQGVTSESSVGVPAFGGGGILGANEYTLQINTNSSSTTSACSGGAPSCTVWEQFLYAPDQLSAGSAGVFIQYWLLQYGANGAACPGGYMTSMTSCFKNSSSVSAPDVPITGLGNLTLTGSVVSGGNDTVTFTNGAMAYSVSAPDSVLKIANVWNQSEFNVVGDAGGSDAIFNTGSVIKVKVAALYGSATAPTCAAGSGTTGETNNLNLLPCSAAGGASPFVQFIESLVTAPTISKAFNPTSIAVGGTSTVTLTLTNPNPGISLTGAAFTDTLFGIFAAGGAVGGTCAGTTPATLSAGATNLSFSNITIPAGASCTVTFTVTGTTGGVFTNTASGVSSNEALTGGTSNTAVLTVVSPPVITKTFSPVKLLPGGTSTVSFSISNPNGAVALTGVAFTDPLPAGLVVATPNGLTSTCGGAATATAGSGTITLSGGGIPAGGICTVTATVTAPEGVYLNSVQVTSTNGGTGNTSSATLTAATPPSLSKTFGEVSIPAFSSTSVSFTLTNPNHVLTLTALAFTDTLPPGLVVSTPNGLAGTCGGGTITAVAGSNLITLAGASLAPQMSCTFSVFVNSDGTVEGIVTNTTSTITSTQALPGAPASAKLFIGDPFQVTYVPNLTAGDSFINITNTGASGAGLGSGTSASVTGSICANVFVFDSSEEIVSCCSCPVTPNGLVSLSAQSDLINNPLTRGNPTSIVIKLLATVPVGGTCTNSALLAGGPSLVLGMAAWGTALHANTAAAPGTYGLTEKGFTNSSLSAGELARLAYTCGAVGNVGSGFGVCNSCRLGGLGAAAR